MVYSSMNNNVIGSNTTKEAILGDLFLENEGSCPLIKKYADNISYVSIVFSISNVQSSKVGICHFPTTKKPYTTQHNAITITYYENDYFTLDHDPRWRHTHIFFSKKVSDSVHKNDYKSEKY